MDAGGNRVSPLLLGPGAHRRASTSPGRSPFDQAEPASTGTAFANDRPSPPGSAVRVCVGQLVNRDKVAIEKEVVAVHRHAGTRLDQLETLPGYRGLERYLHLALGLARAHHHGLRPLARDADAGHDDVPDRTGARARV